MKKNEALEEEEEEEDGNRIQPILLFLKKSHLLNQTEFLNAVNGIV